MLTLSLTTAAFLGWGCRGALQTAVAATPGAVTRLLLRLRLLRLGPELLHHGRVEAVSGQLVRLRGVEQTRRVKVSQVDVHHRGGNVRVREVTARCRLCDANKKKIIFLLPLNSRELQ